jgi:tetratricopeptide (TPR) repeat protein
MKARLSWATWLFCFYSSHSVAVAQMAPAQQSVAVVVVNADSQPAQPVPTVRVSLSYLDNAVRVTEARDVTNPRGQAWLDVSDDAAKRGGLRIEIDGASNLVIYQPADGQLKNGLYATVEISMLPKGSPALLGPAQIQAMLHRTLLRASSLEKQVAALKQSAAAQSQKPDLGAAIAEWAQANGFSAAQAGEQVRQWADGIERQSGQATVEQKALAELALKHYADAAQLFNQASDADRQENNSEDAQDQSIDAQIKALQAAKRALEDRQLSTLQQLLDHAEQAAGANQLEGNNHKATETLENAETTIEAEYKKHPGDMGFHELWLQSVWDSANARESEGEAALLDDGFVVLDERSTLLAQSASDFQSLARGYAALGERQLAAAAEGGLGLALTDEAEDASGEQSVALFNQAMQAYSSALEVLTKADRPQDWARTQGNLGAALEDQGESASGDKAAGLLDQAVQADRNALEVYTRGDFPQNWANVENNLGIALDEEERWCSGDKADALLGQAVQAFQNALEVYTKADLPQDWAATESNLGSALADEGERANGYEASGLLDQAVDAFQNVLEVYTKADLPQDWAETQSNLGIALENEGKRVSRDKATSLFDQAVQAYQNALLVFTKAAQPEHWAKTENNLGDALAVEGTRAAEDKTVVLLDEAAQAYRNALEVVTKADSPQAWAETQVSLGIALAKEGERSGGDKAVEPLNQALQAFRGALDVYTKADDPRDWAMTQIDLGNTLKDEGDRAAGDNADALFAQAMQADQNALAVYTRADQPQGWAMTQMNLAGVDLDAGRFADCLQQVRSLNDRSLPPSRILARDTVSLACQWGAGNKSSALAMKRTLLSSLAATPTPSFAGFAAPIYLFSNSPIFASGRSSWVALFSSLQSADAAGMIAALHQLEPLLEQ